MVGLFETGRLMGLPHRRIPAILSVLLFSLIQCAALCADSTLAGRESDVQELRREVAELRNRLAQLEAALVATEDARKKAADKEAAKGKSPRFDGYVQMRYRNDDASSATDQFFIRRARLNVRATVSEHVSSRIEMQFDGKESGKGPGSKFQLRDAYLDYTDKGNRLRMGQATIPFGFEPLTSSKQLWAGERSFVMDRLFPNEGDVGVQYHFGCTPRRPAFDVALFNGAGVNANDDNNRKDPMASVTLPFEQGSAMLAYYDGARGAGTLRVARTRLGGGVSLDGRHLAFMGEYIAGKDLGADVAGWYSQVGYRLPRAKGMLFVKYDQYDENRDQPDDLFKRTTVGWFRDFDPNVRLTLVYESRKVGASFSDRSKYDGDAGYLQWQVIF